MFIEIQDGRCRHLKFHNHAAISLLLILLKKVVIGRAVTALKQQKSKGKGEDKGIAEIVHLMKPITRSPVSGQTASI
jgi:hypothetical protein